MFHFSLLSLLNVLLALIQILLFAMKLLWSLQGALTVFISLNLFTTRHTWWNMIFNVAYSYYSNNIIARQTFAHNIYRQLLKLENPTAEM